MKITVTQNQKTKVLDLDPTSLIEDVKALIEVEVFNLNYLNNNEKIIIL